MPIPFRLVDVFTDRPLAGNQLCVVPDPLDLPDGLMQAIAREIGFSETTFVTSASHGGYSMRIFTPGSELPFAGHPTLGTAFVMVAEGRCAASLVQRTEVGEVPVEVDTAAGLASMRQPPPAFGPELEGREQMATALRLPVGALRQDLPVRVATTGLPHLMVAAAGEEAVAAARPDGDLVEALLETAGADGLYLFSVDPEARRAKARMFAKGIGVAEDPATGSAAGPLGAHLADLGMIEPGRLVISQGEEIGRPSELRVDVGRTEGGLRVDVGGGVAVVGRGEFDLP